MRELTSREREMLRLLVDEGLLSRKEIARRLGVSPQTVAHQLGCLRRAYGVSKTAALVRLVLLERVRALQSNPRLSVLGDQSAGISASVLERAFG